VVAAIDLPAWQRRAEAVRAVDAGAIARQCAGDPARIKPALHEARLRTLAAVSRFGKEDE